MSREQASQPRRSASIEATLRSLSQSARHARQDRLSQRANHLCCGGGALRWFVVGLWHRRSSCRAVRVACHIRTVHPCMTCHRARASTPIHERTNEQLKQPCIRPCVCVLKFMQRSTQWTHVARAWCAWWCVLRAWCACFDAWRV